MTEPHEERQPVVWLVNEGGHPYDDAQRFGRLMPLTKGSVNPFRPDRLAVTVGQRLAHAKVEDFIALSGLAILNVVVVAMWLTKFETVNLLQWSTKEDKYKLLKIHKSELSRLMNMDIQPAD